VLTFELKDKDYFLLWDLYSIRRSTFPSCLDVEGKAKGHYFKWKLTLSQHPPKMFQNTDPEKLNWFNKTIKKRKLKIWSYLDLLFSSPFDINYIIYKSR
jgi:hypothetical protein